MTQAYNKPLPTPQVESDVYWQKAKEHELWLRYDNDAQQYYFYPRDISPDHLLAQHRMAAGQRKAPPSTPTPLCIARRIRASWGMYPS